MSTFQFIVFRKYGKVSYRIGAQVPHLGGEVAFVRRAMFPGKDTFKLKLFQKVHLHGEHETPLGMKHPHWKRAAKRLQQHTPRFAFQHELGY